MGCALELNSECVRTLDLLAKGLGVNACKREMSREFFLTKYRYNNVLHADTIVMCDS